ncbi:MAG: 30S ribosomal protein S20 [Candidatus Krumholzibacteriota bacterium]|nr:30S ribosomal protein S20 [Candidatus Krumholzibacteriota bacterium]
MPEHKSCLKRMRQNETRRQINKRYKSFLVHSIRSFKKIEDPEAAKEEFPRITSIIDKSRKKGILHKNKASRIKSRLSKKTS